jgi:hypothetical protein
MGDGRLAARFVGPKWETGLGFLGIPAAKILSLSEDSPLFVGTADGGLVHEFTRSGVVESDKGRIWEPEDFHLCRRLGGVDLLDLRIAHLKTVPLSPNPEMLRALIDKHEIRPSAEELAEFTESMTAIAK